MKKLFLMLFVLVLSAPAFADEHGGRYNDIRERFRNASPDERKQMREEFHEKREERKARFEEKWESAPPEKRNNFCSTAQERCDSGRKLACHIVEQKCN